MEQPGMLKITGVLQGGTAICRVQETILIHSTPTTWYSFKWKEKRGHLRQMGLIPCCWEGLVWYELESVLRLLWALVYLEGRSDENAIHLEW